jgi:hypothetical protein
VTALVAVAGIADAVSLARRARDELAPHGRIELVESAGVELVAEAAGTHPPLAGTAMVIIESSPGGPSAALRAFLGAAAEARGLLVADDPHGRADLWSWRDAMPATLAALGLTAAFEVRVELDKVPSLVEVARSELARLSRSLVLVAYGSLGTCSLHLDVVGGHPGDAAVHEALVGVIYRSAGGLGPSDRPG